MESSQSEICFDSSERLGVQSGYISAMQLLLLQTTPFPINLRFFAVRNEFCYSQNQDFQTAKRKYHGNGCHNETAINNCIISDTGCRTAINGIFNGSKFFLCIYGWLGRIFFPVHNQLGKGLFEFVRFQTSNVETGQSFPNNEDIRVVKMRIESIHHSYFAGIDIRVFQIF